MVANVNTPKRVFISYATPDKPLAQAISQYLKSANFVVDDMSSVMPGQDLLSAITERIERSDAIVILISDASKNSGWVRTETSLALGSALSDANKQILPVILDESTKTPSDLQGIMTLRVDSRSVSSPLKLGQRIGQQIYEALLYSPPRQVELLADALELQTKALRQAEELPSKLVWAALTPALTLLGIIIGWYFGGRTRQPRAKQESPGVPEK